MDDHRFDDLVRSLATTSRRRAARLLVAGLVGALALPIEDAIAACVRLGRACGRGKRCCAGTACRSGRCRCASGVPCAGRCCPAGQRCADGRCIVPCVPEETWTTCGVAGCGPKVNNCGQSVDCGVCELFNQVCGAGGVCDCREGTERCAGVCVDTATEFGDCGRCGRSCRRNERCTDGKCFSVYCPAVADCTVSPVPACDITKSGRCLCMTAVDGGTFCGDPALNDIVPCASDADCLGFGLGPGCVHHPNRCGMGAVCVGASEISS